MSEWTRREILKIGVVAPAAAAASVSPAAQRLLQTAASVPSTREATEPSGRERLLLDFGWRFHLGHANDPAQDFGFGILSAFAKSGWLSAPARADFDDRQWRAIDLPHDFAVELPFENDKTLVDHGCKPLGRAYPATSIGWYRRVFAIPASDAGRRLSIEFDGVYRDCVVALNGHYLGRNLSGYAPFWFDVTDFVNYGGKNILTVRVDATENEGWFYEGAGIYRHVWLVKTPVMHAGHWGTFITSEVRGSAAILSIATQVENDSAHEKTCHVVSIILDGSGKEVGRLRSAPAAIPAWGSHEFKQQISVNRAALWSLEEPHMYKAVTTVEAGEGGADRYETPFGIRTLHFDPDKGFFLNGKPVRVRGTCNHQDHAGVGAALPDRIQYYRIGKLKEMGANAYRTSHNPPTPELLDACDRLGMLVMDETRMFSSDEEGLSQLERMVRRDRNHPSVFLWSLGNEEPEQGTDRGERMAATMKRLVRSLDPTRPVTFAMNGSWGKGLSRVVDVQGFNYEKNGSVDKFHADFPHQPTIGSEETSAFSTRGIYEKDELRGYISAYDVNAPRYGTTAEEWVRYFAARPFLAGAFVWTGFDYRGEPSPYSWPCISSHFGIMDTCGFPKDTFYYYQAWWGDKPVVHLFPHWNWAGREGREINVWVHSNCDEVELLLNGRSLGKQTMTRLSHLEWKVNYTPGTLLARGFKAGKLIAEDKRETTGGPAAIRLTPDRATLHADGEDVSLVAVAVVDAEGRVVPLADNEISFDVTGPGKIIGVGNGDPSCHQADKGTRRSVFGGLGQVIVQSNKQVGDITLRAESAGLQSASTTIRAQTVLLRPAVPA